MVDTPKGPNPLTAAWSIWRASQGRHPQPTGTAAVDHAELAPVLAALRSHGVATLVNQRAALHAYRDRMATIDPDNVSPPAALAYWLNLYNAGALELVPSRGGEPEQPRRDDKAEEHQPGELDHERGKDIPRTRNKKQRECHHQATDQVRKRGEDGRFERRCHGGRRRRRNTHQARPPQPRGRRSGSRSGRLSGT
jgi:hypothetical protein